MARAKSPTARRTSAGAIRAAQRGVHRRQPQSDVETPLATRALRTEVEKPVPDEIRVRRLHRRDLHRVWEFLKLSFRDVNRDTVEYQRPRSRQRFFETYDDEGVEQLVFEIADPVEGSSIAGYCECAFEVIGSDNWVNPRYFEKRDMRPLFVEELATHPDHHGRGIGSFILEQLEHLARLRGCTHLVLEVAENNSAALSFYRKRSFVKMDAAIFMAQKIAQERELLPPKTLTKPSIPASTERKSRKLKKGSD